MKRSVAQHWGRVAVLIGVSACLLTGCLKTRKEAIEARRQETLAKAEAIYAKVDQLKPGMTEAEVIEIVGADNWGSFMNVGTHSGLNKMVMSYPDNQFLVFEWRYEGDAAAIQKLPLYHDPEEDGELDAALIKTLANVRLSDEPL